jgi:hypothetical protein
VTEKTPGEKMGNSRAAMCIMIGIQAIEFATIQGHASWFFRKYFLSKTQRSKQEGQEIHQQSPIFEIDQGGQRPAPKTEHDTGAKAVNKPNQEDAQYSHLK